MSDFAAAQHQSETSAQLNFVSCGVLGAVFSRPLWGLLAHVMLLEVLSGGLGAVLGWYRTASGADLVILGVSCGGLGKYSKRNKGGAGIQDGLWGA